MAPNQSPPVLTPLFCIPDNLINLWKPEELLGLCCSLYQEANGYVSLEDRFEEKSFYEVIKPSLVCEVESLTTESKNSQQVLGIKLIDNTKGYHLTFLNDKGDKSPSLPLWYDKPNYSFYKRFLCIY